ncbi:MAG: 5-nitroimidazole antibiotic resistance protein [Clostridiaceae bacterium]|nr:5-nitroimidazole antibiotic resistance protein [Clostridiaceae bacterium]
MRRKDRKMDRAFGLEVIDRCQYAVMSAVLPDGNPYGVPLSMVRIGGQLYFHCAQAGKKLDALRHNPRVSVACVGHVRPLTNDFTTEYESALVTGKAIRVEDEEEKIRALRATCLRYTPDNMDQFDAAIARSLHRTDVWKIDMEEITAKRKKYDADGKEIKSNL